MARLAQVGVPHHGRQQVDGTRIMVAVTTLPPLFAPKKLNLCAYLLEGWEIIATFATIKCK